MGAVMNKARISFLIFFAAVLVFAGCKTVVPVRIIRPAEIDLSSFDAVVVLPFEKTGTDSYNNSGSKSLHSKYTPFDPVFSDSKDIQKIKDYICSEFSNQIKESTYLKTMALEKLRNESAKTVYILGSLISYESSIDSYKTDKQIGGKLVSIPTFKKTLNFSLVLNFIDDLETKHSVYTVNQDVRVSSVECEDKYELPDDFTLAKRNIDAFVAKTMRSIQPYDSVKKLTLMYHNDAEMRKAAYFAKEEYFTVALERYSVLFETKGYYEAGYNAAVLQEVVGNLEAAKQMILELEKRFTDKKNSKRTASALAEIETEISYSETLKKQRGF